MDNVIRSAMMQNAFHTLVLCLILPFSALAQNIVISEVMFNPDGDENAREYVELHNTGDTAISLEGWAISDGTAADLIIPSGAEGLTVQPGSYALIFDPDYFEANEPYAGIPDGIPRFTVGDRAIGNRGLSNSIAEPVLLISTDGDTTSSVTYSLDCPPGHSWERIQLTGDDTRDNFSASHEPEGTPGSPNSAAPPKINPAITAGDIMIAPESPSMGGMITITARCRNAGTESLKNCRITVLLGPDTVLLDHVFESWLDPGEASDEITADCNRIPGGLLSLTALVCAQNASPGSAFDDTVSIDLHIPIPPETVLLTEVMAAPQENGSEWVEVMNLSEVPVCMFGWTVSDGSGASSAPTNSPLLLEGRSYAVLAEKPLPEYDIPGSVPVMILNSFPSLNNDTDTVNILDAEGEALDAAGWQDAPSGLSLERIDVAPGTGHGWDTCVDSDGATPGRDNSILYAGIGEDEPDALTLSAEPNPFDQTTRISYALPFPLARIRLLVYDRRGRPVRKIRDVEESGSVWSGTWNGCDDGGCRLDAGPYILYFEAFDKKTGKLHARKVPVVVAARL